MVFAQTLCDRWLEKKEGEGARLVLSTRRHLDQKIQCEHGGRVMQFFFAAAYFVIGFAQLFAIIEFFEQTLDWGFFDVILAFFVTYIPILGSILGVFGATDGWGWSIWQAGALFFWYVPVYAVAFLIDKFSER